MRNPDAVAKSGIMPKPGQAKVMFGNINGAAAAITFNNKTINVAAGAGTKSRMAQCSTCHPQIQIFDQAAGRPSESDVVEVGADETWD